MFKIFVDKKRSFKCREQGVKKVVGDGIVKPARRRQWLRLATWRGEIFRLQPHEDDEFLFARTLSTLHHADNTRPSKTTLSSASHGMKLFTTSGSKASQGPRPMTEASPQSDRTFDMVDHPLVRGCSPQKLKVSFSSTSPDPASLPIKLG